MKLIIIGIIVLLLTAIMIKNVKLKHIKIILEKLHIVDWVGSSRIVVVKKDLKIKNWPKKFDGLKIIQLSDLHQNDFNGELIENMVKETNKLEPDLILLTGDYIQYDEKPINPLVNRIKHLKSKHGIFAVYGNHDCYKKSSKAMILSKFTDIGIRMLENELVYPAIETDDENADSFAIIGLGDLWDQNFDPLRPFLELQTIRENIGKHIPVITLSHNPDTAEELKSYTCDLILSGHTHGGSIKIPFIGSAFPYYKKLITSLPNKYKSYFPYTNYLNVVDHIEWVEGIHKIDRLGDNNEKNILYVSSGVGSHESGFRIFCPPEINVFTITSKE